MRVEIPSRHSARSRSEARPTGRLPEPLVVRLRARQSLSGAEATVAGREPPPWLFPAPSDDTKPMNAAFLRFKVWYRLLRRAEVRAIRIHDLRHTYASLLLLAGEPCST